MPKLIIFGLLTIMVIKLQAQVVTVDNYFNHETRKNALGEGEDYHYLWTDKANTGFSIWGEALQRHGAHLRTLKQAPTLQNLSATDIYIIVDPDTRKESPKPNYIQSADIDQLVKWVRSGGILVLMANDSANVELPHFNQLTTRFGMRFNDDMQNHVIDDAHFEDGAIITTNNPLFATARKIYMKDVCSISVKAPAQAALKNSNGATIIATAQVGKGLVLAAGDPWLYNEYTNGRLPAGFENDKAADDIAAWLIAHAKKHTIQ